MKAGGAERVISHLANHMCNKGIKCTIVTLDNEKIFYPLVNTIKIHKIGKKSKNTYIDKFLKYKELRRYIKYNKPDIVLALPEEIGIYVIPALLGTKIPVIVSERNNPWVMPWKKETRIMRKVFYPFAAGIIFQTKQAASFFSPKIRQKGVVLPNPIDLHLIPEPFVGKRRKEVVGAGRLNKQKNFHLLIQAFSKFHGNHPDYTLTIYGEGALREELENYAASLLPKGVYSFPGRSCELLELIRDAAMFVLSSDYEGMPNILIETMAMGMPVISTDCPSGGPAELIESGKNGILIPVGDKDLLSLEMCKIAESKELAFELGKNAIQIKKKLNCVSEKWLRYLNKFV